MVELKGLTNKIRKRPLKLGEPASLHHHQLMKLAGPRSKARSMRKEDMQNNRNKDQNLKHIMK